MKICALQKDRTKLEVNKVTHFSSKQANSEVGAKYISRWSCDIKRVKELPWSPCKQQTKPSKKFNRV